MIPWQYCKRTTASESIRHQCCLSAMMSVVGYLILCLFPSWLCCSAIAGGLSFCLATLNLALWQGSKAELQCRWVSLGWCGWEKGLQHERCSIVGEEESLTFCWYQLVLNSPDVTKNPLNIYQYSSRIGLDHFVERCWWGECRLDSSAGFSFSVPREKNIQK